MDAVKMPAPLNMRREDFLASMCNKLDKMMESRCKKRCFMYTEGFENSKRFARFVSETRNDLNKYLAAHFSVFEFDEKEGEIIDDVCKRADSVYALMRDTVKSYFRQATEKITQKKSVFQDFVDSQFEYDISMRSHRYIYSSVFEKEQKFYDSLSEDENGEKKYDDALFSVIQLWILRDDNKAYNAFFGDNENILSFREAVDFHIKELCRDRIQFFAFTDKNTDEVTYFKNARFSEQDLFRLMLDLLSALIIETGTVAETVYSFIRDKDKWDFAVSNLRIDMANMQERYEKQTEGLNEQITFLKRRLEESAVEKRLLEDRMKEACEDAVKPYKKELSNAKKQAESQKDKYLKLVEKYQSLEEYVSLIENAVDEEFADEEIWVDEKVFQKKIIFIRESKYSNYAMMSKLLELFPNARFANSITADIDKQTADMVVLLTRYTKHGTYWGARDTSKRAGIPCIHCDNSNYNAIVKTIAEYIWLSSISS